MTTRAEFDVKVMFVSFFRYRHENTEVWGDGCLRGISSETEANSDRFIVRGELNEKELIVDNGSVITPLGGCVKTFAYWDYSFLSENQLLNSQTGEYEDISVEKLGEELVQVQDRLIPATHYRLNAETGPVSLWYGASNKLWLGLESVATGGRVIRYEPKRLPDAFIEGENAD